MKIRTDSKDQPWFKMVIMMTDVNGWMNRDTKRSIKRERIFRMTHPKSGTHKDWTMSHQDLYRELSKKVGAEQSKIVPQIWKTVCTPEEATLLNVLPATLEDLAQRFERSQEIIGGMLQVLFYKGLVFKVKREGILIYHMPRHIIQFHDASALWPEAPPELIDLWRQYTQEEYPQIPAALTALKVPPFFRVIPVNEKIEMKNQVLAYEDASTIVEKASLLTVANCPCRMIMRKCDKPTEVCIQLNRAAEYSVERGTGRRIDVSEAKSILLMAEKAGLVHLTENKAGLGTVICNCCNCCCIALPFAKNVATCGMLVPSRYRANIDGDRCTGCGLCVDDCPMGAINAAEKKIAMVNTESCIGCGVCTHVCPADTISLIAVREKEFIPS